MEGKIRQRPHFREAKHFCRRLYKNMLKVQDKDISQSIKHNKEDNILNNKLMIMRSTPERFTPELDGDIVLEQVRIHLRSGSRTKNGSRIKVGIIGVFLLGLNSKTILRSKSSAQGKLSHRTTQQEVHVQPQTFCPYSAHDVARSRVAQDV